MRIQLKSINKEPQTFAVLVRPYVEIGEVNNNEELYDKVLSYGSAVIRKYKSYTFDLEEGEITLPPEDFCIDWEGD